MAPPNVKRLASGAVVMSTAHPVTAWAKANAVTVLSHFLPDTARKLSRHGRAPCPVHGGESPDSFRFDRAEGVWYCHSKCGGGGDIVDLVQRVLRLTDRTAARDAIASLAPLDVVHTAERSGLAPRTAAKRTRNRAQRPAPALIAPPKASPSAPPKETLPETVRTALQTLRDGGMIPDTPRGIYTAALKVMQLGLQGHAYLKHRGISPDVAWLYGFRSIESAEDWHRLDTYLAECFTDVERAAAMLPAWDEQTDAPGRLPTYFTPALAIPYLTLDGAGCVGFRLRHLTRTTGRRYHALGGTTFPLPFNAPAISKSILHNAGREVHIVEGELNAFTLLHYGLNAVGIPGAGKWDPAWTEALKRAARIVAWYDKDGAGDQAWTRLQSNLAAGGVHTASTLKRAIIPRVTVPSDEEIKDLNDWHRLDPDSLRKTLTLAPWRQ